MEKSTLLNETFFSIVETEINRIDPRFYYVIPQDFKEYPEKILLELKMIDYDYRISSITKEEAYWSFGKLLLDHHIAEAVKVPKLQDLQKMLENLKELVDCKLIPIDEYFRIYKKLVPIINNLTIKNTHNYYDNSTDEQGLAL